MIYDDGSEAKTLPIDLRKTIETVSRRACKHGNDVYIDDHVHTSFAPESRIETTSKFTSGASHESVQFGFTASNTPLIHPGIESCSLAMIALNNTSKLVEVSGLVNTLNRFEVFCSTHCLFCVFFGHTPHQPHGPNECNQRKSLSSRPGHEICQDCFATGHSCDPFQSFYCPLKKKFGADGKVAYCCGFNTKVGHDMRCYHLFKDNCPISHNAVYLCWCIWRNSTWKVLLQTEFSNLFFESDLFQLPDNDKQYSDLLYNTNFDYGALSPIARICTWWFNKLNEW
jgi:hypothetical protein